MTTARARRQRGRSSTRAVTMMDVGRAAGVSAQTVSRALSKPDEVSEDTRERVRRAVADTGYVPNLAASHLASNRSRTIAAILPVISTSVFSDTLRAAASVVGPAGYQLIVGYTDYRVDHEEEVIRAFIQRRPDAFLIVGTVHTDETLKLLEGYGAPVVETWDWNDNPLDTLVGFSNADAARDVVTYLVERGHRRIAFAGAMSPGDSRAARRLEGYRDQLSVEVPGEPLRIVDLPDREVSMDTGVELFRVCRARFPEATAIMFATDVFAGAAILAAQRDGIEVPDQIAITGFGDFDLSQHVVPSLTTVSVDVDTIGRRAGELLLDRLAGRVPAGRHLDVGYDIVARESA